jgi:hypothetical protein
MNALYLITDESRARDIRLKKFPSSFLAAQLVNDFFFVLLIIPNHELKYFFLIVGLI